MLAAAETVGVSLALPAWMLVLFTAATGLATVITTLRLVTSAVKPIHAEIRAWMATTDMVAAQGPRWDAGLAQLAEAVSQLAEVTRTIGNVQADVALIREQVTIDSGESLKDRVIQMQGSLERQATLDEEGRDEVKADLEADRASDAAERAQDRAEGRNRQRGVRGHLDRQDDAMREESDEHDEDRAHGLPRDPKHPNRQS